MALVLLPRTVATDQHTRLASQNSFFSLDWSVPNMSRLIFLLSLSLSRSLFLFRKDKCTLAWKGYLPRMSFHSGYFYCMPPMHRAVSW